ncbi:ParB N-terminal domain-containing protein [Syntrophorhabdus aromaticivorans]|uniref:ParB N-terminal domain-containing protein n=1 Tax=Syntrophorhabdus aromaticivorans TaxID=328301 RepID=UPI000422F75D|nr:ParB N-terminal domain-containing protein [Syntrophorhabdus aromaticivorans]
MIEIENVSIRKLKPAAYNPRKIDGATLDRLARGMEEFGIVDPIIINKDGTVIGGHQRIKAAEKLGLSEVPCVRLDLDKTKEKTLNLALNKISGEWDMGLLKDLLIELDSGAFDIELTGFSAKELEKLMVRNTVEDAFKNTAAHSKPGACVYVAHADINTADLRGALTRAGIYVSQTLVWVKSGRRAVEERLQLETRADPLWLERGGGPLLFAELYRNIGDRR